MTPPRLPLPATGLVLAALAVGCDLSVVPPRDPGVCWRADFQRPRRPVFTVAADESPNLVSCAADLELAYLSEGHEVTGAYNGYYIFVGPTAITSADRLDRFRYPVFNDLSRARIDGRLRAVIAARAADVNASEQRPTRRGSP